MTTETKLPLDGVTVLDLTRLIPGAFCTAMLGDAGAEVIKVEETKVGDYERQIHPFNGSIASRFLILNRNKKSVSLNLKVDEGRNALLRMVACADVLVEGFRPGVMKKLNLDYETLKKVNPRLVYCSISSFGQDGPCRDEVAHDINILGMAGFFDITGMKDGPPVIPGVQVADSIAGMYGAMGILMALVMRERTHIGQYIDISMFDGVMSWIFDAARYVFAGEQVPGRGRGRLWGGFPNYNLYETRDGKFITVGSLETKFKNVLLKKLGRSDLMDVSQSTTSVRGSENDEEISAFLKATFLSKTRNEWIQELGELNICIGPVNTIDEALAHPQTLFRKMVLKDAHSFSSPIRQIGSALKFSDALRSPAPELGEHTREILSGIGYEKEELDALEMSGIIRTGAQGSNYVGN